MKKELFLIAMLLLSGFSSAWASSDVEVKVDSLTNTANSTVIEACGTAVDKAGVTPLLVTIKHGGAQYSTMTGQQGKWCVLIRRWNWNGKVDVSGATLKDSGNNEFKTFYVPLQTVN